MGRKCVLCVGDSLTAGWYIPSGASRPEFAPYATSMSTTLGENVDVIPLGWPGWTSSELRESAGTYAAVPDAPEGSPPLPGLQLAIRKHKPAMVVLMAGTNDLGSPTDGEIIARSVWSLHEISHSLGVQTAAISVPGWCEDMYPSLDDANRTKLNKRLMEFCTQSPHATYVDFPFTYEQKKDLFAEDGLHFSPRGSAELGAYVGVTLQSHPALKD